MVGGKIQEPTVLKFVGWGQRCHNAPFKAEGTNRVSHGGIFWDQGVDARQQWWFLCGVVRYRCGVDDGKSARGTGVDLVMHGMQGVRVWIDD
jgi:hypothetical protein